MTNTVIVFRTRNSVYTVSDVQGAETVELRCISGTFAGEAWNLTRNEWNNSTLIRGESGRFGALTTSRIQEVSWFYVNQPAPVAGYVFREPHAFVAAVVDHVVGPDRAIFVDEVL